MVNLFGAAVAFFVLCGLSTLNAQKIEVIPAQVMVDEAASIVVTGIAPESRITIRAELTDGGNHEWASNAEFLADTQGSVNTAKQAPVTGSYHTVSALGLVWSMRPLTKDTHIYETPASLGSQTINFHLFQDGKEVSSAQIQQLAIRPGVRKIRVDGLIHGILFVPAEGGRHPGVLVLGGSEGGLPSHRAAWLASHGYTAFALCYFHCEGTPANLEDIPLEYFGQALGWMMQRPEIDAEQLAVMGASRGGELALQLGSMYPQIGAVVAYVPANVRYAACCEGPPHAAWTWHGQPLAWAGLRMAGNPEIMFRAAIAVEHTHGPVLLIGGRDDGVWPSAEMVDLVASRLRQSHFAYDVVVLKYADAGHRAGFPEIVPTWHKGVTHPLSGRVVNLGGTPEGDAMSSLDAIPKVLQFLQKSFPGNR